MILPLDSDDASVKPFIHEGRAMLPMRAVSRALNYDGPFYCDVDWHDSERKAVLFWRDESDPSFYHTVAEFWVGSTDAVFYDVDGDPKQVKISSAPMIVNNRTYLPLRAIADALEIGIEWVPSKQGIVIYFWERPQYVIFPDRSRIEF